MQKTLLLHFYAYNLNFNTFENNNLERQCLIDMKRKIKKNIEKYEKYRKVNNH